VAFESWVQDESDFNYLLPQCPRFCAVIQERKINRPFRLKQRVARDITDNTACRVTDRDVAQLSLVALRGDRVLYRVGHKSLDTSKRFKCIFVERLMAHPVLVTFSDNRCRQCGNTPGRSPNPFSALASHQTSFAAFSSDTAPPGTWWL
jgi:hypothetical protein